MNSQMAGPTSLNKDVGKNAITEAKTQNQLAPADNTQGALREAQQPCDPSHFLAVKL